MRAGAPTQPPGRHQAPSTQLSLSRAMSCPVSARRQGNRGMRACARALRQLDGQGHALHPGGLAVQFLCAKERACCISVTQTCVHLHSQHPHMQATMPHTCTYTVLHSAPPLSYQPPPGVPTLEEILWESSGQELAQLGVYLVTLLFISVKCHPQKLLCSRKPAAEIIVGFDSQRFGSISWLHMKCACSEHPFSSLFDH